MAVVRSLYQYGKRMLSVLLTLAMLLSLTPLYASSVEEDEGGTYDLPWLWPVPGSYKINSLDYYYTGGIHNRGQCLDIGSNGYTGSNRLDIISATSGTVLYIQNKYNETSNKGSGWGNYVIVRTGNINIIYGHLKTVSCGYGAIKAGDVIGKMGNTGNSTGVHLHLQAYPVGENASSTAIPAFEQFRTNPLYYPHFQFMKGLKTESPRYGEWIAKYYTTSSGSYYTYSGGLDFPLSVTRVAATVTVIRTDGASIRTMPLNDNSYNVDTIRSCDSVDVSGYYVDGYGVSWLLLADESDGRRWICADDVGFKDYRFGVTLENDISPEGSYGYVWDLPFGGTLTAGNPIESFTVTLTRAETVVASYTKTVGTYRHTLDESIRVGLAIDSLADGEYTYTLSVKEKAEYPGVDPMTVSKTVVTSTFTIDGTLSDQTSPVLEAIRIDALTFDSLVLSFPVTDDRQMDKVTLAVTASDDSFTKDYVAELTDGIYVLTVPVSDLPGTGSYNLTAAAYDTYGNKDVTTRTVQIPGSTKAETWKVDYKLKIRSGPGTSYTHLKTLSVGTILAVSEVVVASGYTWGKTPDGWCALDYCTYQSGALYTVNFDLNGGSGEIPSSLDKSYGQNLTLPTVKPTREGYQFLGWATSSYATEALVTAGGAYTRNLSETLFAVWGDAEKPVISGISVDPASWTNQSITVTVTATDNTSELLYSFDAGKSWSRTNTLVLTEAKVFAAGSILVKDASGNVTSNETTVTVDGIDTTPPDLSESTATPSVSGNNVTLNLSGITDALSGVESVEATFMPNEEGKNPLTALVPESGMVTLENGVYTWQIKVTDRAGNVSVKEFSRFRVGDTEKLATPTGLTVVSTTSSSATLVWSAVPHADSYHLTFSKAADFSGTLIEHDVADVTTFTAELAWKETYYCRIVARSADGVYLTSDASESVSFCVLSNDTSVKGFASMSDAVIDSAGKTVLWMAPNTLSAIDITATVDALASVTYWKDSSKTVQLTGTAVTAFSLAGDYATAYLLVKAENGDEALYTLTVKRSGSEAEEPTVTYTPTPQTLPIGTVPTPLSLTASVSDGGTVTVDWYVSFNGGAATKMGEGTSFTPSCQAVGSYKIHAVVTNTNPKCQTTTATVTTEAVTITVTKLDAKISVIVSSYVYNELPPSVAYSNYYGSGTVTFRFYADPNGSQEIDPPTLPGYYYAVASAEETETHKAATSWLTFFEIRKLDNSEIPQLTVVQPTVRDPNGYVTVESNRVEYRIVGSTSWIAAGRETLSFPEATAVEFRVPGSATVKNGPIQLVKIENISGAVDIVPNESMGFTVENGLLFLNGSSISVDMLFSGLKDASGINLYSASGIRLNESEAIVSTGCYVAIEDASGIVMSLPIIVNGDVNCDGVVTETDAHWILYLSNGMMESESELDFPAGDLDSDGALTSVDAYLALLMAS